MGITGRGTRASRAGRKGYISMRDSAGGVAPPFQAEEWYRRPVWPEPGAPVAISSMSAGPADSAMGRAAGAPKIARSAVIVGRARLGEGSLLAQGAVIRSHGSGVEVDTGSAVLENSGR